MNSNIEHLKIKGILFFPESFLIKLTENKRNLKYFYSNSDLSILE